MTSKTLIVLFNLREGVAEADYEKWAHETDLPIASSLKSVDEFKVYRSEGLFGSDGNPPYRYVEVLHISSMEDLPADIAAEPRMVEIARQFQAFADNPTFMVTENFAG